MVASPEAKASAERFADESPAVPASSLTLIEGTSFVICGGAGDIGDAAVDGVFVGDTRVCDQLVLTVDGERIEALAATQPSPFHAVMVGRTGPSGMLVFRDHWVGTGLRADLRVRNFGPESRRATVAYTVGSDLAGLFEVKEGRPPDSRATVSVENGVLRLGARDGPRSATVRSSPPGALASDGTVIWAIEVPPRGEWTCCIEVAAVRDGQEVPPSYRCGAPTERAAPSSAPSSLGGHAASPRHRRTRSR